MTPTVFDQIQKGRMKPVDQIPRIPIIDQCLSNMVPLPKIQVLLAAYRGDSDRRLCVIK